MYKRQAYSFEGWNAHQSLGMLITKRMEKSGLKPLGFVANDYGLACYGLEPVTDPQSLFSADILEREFVEWVERSNLLKNAFREVAVIGGLVERQHPGKRKTGRQRRRSVAGRGRSARGRGHAAGVTDIAS